MEENITAASINRQDTFLALGDAGGDLHVVDMQLNEIIASLETEADYIYEVKLSPDGGRVAYVTVTGDDEETQLFLLDIASGEITQLILPCVE
jgi:dipeptidyl aminopeptidase/acylaminoacyl peptidase